MGHFLQFIDVLMDRCTIRWFKIDLRVDPRARDGANLDLMLKKLDRGAIKWLRWLTT